MAPPKRPWFRFYVEALADPKLRRLSAEERWLWVVVLGMARQSPVPGWLLVTESIPLEPDDLSEMAGVTSAKVGKGLQKMVALGLLIHDKDGTYRVTKWDERQFESDDTTKRTAKHRSKNGDTSTMERPNDVDVAPPDTESDTETEPSSSSVTASHPRTDDDDVWIEYAHLAATANPNPVGNFARWSAKVIADAQERFGHDLDTARTRTPDATPEQLARFLFDGTEPPGPRVFWCSDCQDNHAGACDLIPADLIPASPYPQEGE